MAIYHCSIKILSRSAGRSSVQFSAYMSGSEMHDERRDETFSHLSKEEVCFSDMMFTERIPEELRNPEKFWNNVEANEKQSNSQVARTFELALPHELTIEQNIELTKGFAQSLLEDGMPAVQIAVHKKDGNWHAHIMVPMRDFKDGKWQAKEKKIYNLDDNGNKIPILDEHGNQKFRERKGKGKEWLWERKTIQVNPWNNRSMLKQWRKRFADLQNAALEKNNKAERVDHRSYEDQGIELIPTIHEGYNARKLEREGGISNRCQYNRDVKSMNDEIIKINEEIIKITAQIKQSEQEAKNLREQKKEHSPMDSYQAKFFNDHGWEVKPEMTWKQANEIMLTTAYMEGLISRQNHKFMQDHDNVISPELKKKLFKYDMTEAERADVRKEVIEACNTARKEERLAKIESVSITDNSVYGSARNFANDYMTEHRGSLKGVEEAMVKAYADGNIIFPDARMVAEKNNIPSLAVGHVMATVLPDCVGDYSKSVERFSDMYEAAVNARAEVFDPWKNYNAQLEHKNQEKQNTNSNNMKRSIER